MNKIFGESKNKALWADFYGLRNDEDLLNNKAEALAPVLVGLAEKSQKSLQEMLNKNLSEKDTHPDFKKTIEKITPQKWNNAFYEFLFVYLHAVDRLAFQYLEPEQRNVFTDGLFAKALAVLSEGIREEDYLPFATEDLLIETYNKRQEYYSTFDKLYPEKEGAPPANTVFWEFGELLAKTLTGESKDIAIALPAQFIAAEYILILELPQLFMGKEVKSKK